MTKFKFKKTVQALNLFATLEGGRINRMKAIKLIWLADRSHLLEYARLITGDDYVLMKNGIVASGAKDLAESSNFLQENEKNYRNLFIENDDAYHFKSIKEPDTDVFSDSDLEILKSIYSTYKHLDAFDLSNLSHEFPEWKKYEHYITSGQRRCYPIDHEDFFSGKHDEDVKEIFNEYMRVLNI